MNKFTAAACALLLALLGAVMAALPAGAVGPALSETLAYCIIDADTGLVLAGQNMDMELHPASITKVMTMGLACEKAAGDWDLSCTVSHDDVYSLAGTDSSHIALQENEAVPLEDLLYATAMASANDAANVLAEYVGGSIEGGVAAMNAQAEELGLQHTRFANPHGISDDEHYTSCRDIAQIFRWALQQPGFEDLITRNEVYVMEPTNLQPVTRYFSMDDPMRNGGSRYYVPSILGSKTGYTNIARYSYVCLAEQNGVRLICATIHSELKTDKYADVAALLDYAFSRWTGAAGIPGGSETRQVEVVGGGGPVGAVALSDPGISLPLAPGLTASDVTVSLELPEQYRMGEAFEGWAVYTVNGGSAQESASVRVPLSPDSADLAALFEASRGGVLPAAEDLAPAVVRWQLAVAAAAGLLAAAAAVRLARGRARARRRF